jgi:hypothetical protein
MALVVSTRRSWLSMTPICSVVKFVTARVVSDENCDVVSAWNCSVEKASQSSLVNLDSVLVERAAICAVVRLVISEAIVRSCSEIHWCRVPRAIQGMYQQARRTRTSCGQPMHSNGSLASVDFRTRFCKLKQIDTRRPRQFVANARKTPSL